MIIQAKQKLANPETQFINFFVSKTQTQKTNKKQ